MKKSIEFTEQEANVLLSIIDAANKAQGLTISGNCVYFAEKLTSAFKTEETPALETVK